MSERGEWKSVLNAAGAGRIFPAAFVILLAVVLFVALLAGVTGSARAYNPAPNLEPNPELEGNVTFSSHSSGWSSLTYSTTNVNVNSTLVAALDPRVPNPIVVNPSGVISTGVLQTGKAAGLVWNTSTTHGSGAGWICGGNQKGGTITLTPGTANGAANLQIISNTTAAGTQSPDCYFNIPVADLPSTNPAFDYLTLTFTWSGSSCGSCSLSVGVENESTKASNGQTTAQGFAQYSSKYGTIIPLGVAGGTTFTSAASAEGMFSASLAQLSSSNCGMNLSGYGPAGQQTQYAGFFITWGLPAAASTAYTFTVTGMAVTTTALTLGTTNWYVGGRTVANLTPIVRQVIPGNANLTALSPSFAYTQVAGGGYTAAVVQRAQDLPGANVTITYGTASVANTTTGGPGYVEQIDYNFLFQLPVASSLSYGSFKLADSPFVAGTQYVSVTFAGTSYTTAYQGYVTCSSVTGKCTGVGAWVTPQSSVTPTTSQAWVGIIYLTGPQWDSISSAPSIFSANGAEFLWFELIAAILAIGGVSSAWVTQNERGLRNRVRGVGRVDFWSLRDNRRGALHLGAHHVGALILAGLLGGAGLIAGWAFLDGADLNGLFGSFLAGLLLVGVIFLIAFVIYEVWRRASHGRRGVAG